MTIFDNKGCISKTKIAVILGKTKKLWLFKPKEP